MNKKFSTLMAAALLAGSFSVVAQNAHPNDPTGLANGEITYRSQFVKSASLDQGLFGVNKIESDKWYQLVVNADSDMKANKETMVLTQERDYATGRLYLAVKPIQDATLTHSLWKIVYNPQAVNGNTWQFINKETGMPLTFNHTDALTLTADECSNLLKTYTKKADGNVPVNYLDPSYFDEDHVNRKSQETGVADLTPTINRGCISNWGWNHNRENTLDYYNSKLLYSYYHAGTDSIMALAMVKMGDEKSNRYDPNQYYVKTIKASQADFAEPDLFNDKKGNALVHIMPVVAGAKVLTADEINSMIDADGSFLNFLNKETSRKNPKYDRDNDYVKDTDKGEYKENTVKFTILNRKGEVATVYNNPFDTTWYAVESDYEQLDRRNFDHQMNYGPITLKANLKVDYKDHAASGTATPYAGYNILFRNEKSGWYLKVLNELHEAGEDGNYNALKVQSAPYTYTDPSREMTGDEARYHWKATYYATNDSLVLEPLNASRHNYEETDPDPIDSSKNALDFFNTVNEGKAFVNTPTSTDGEPQAFNKAKGVPVALYLMNIGAPQADSQYLLTVGTPSGLNTFVANLYPAVPKYDATKLEYGFNYTYTDDENTDGNNRNYKAGEKSGEYFVASNNPAYVTNAKSYYKLYIEVPANKNAENVSGTMITNSTASVVAANDKSVDYNLSGTQWMRLKFDHEYSHLTRSTKEDALYFIQLKTDKGYTGNGSRVNGAYLVMNHQGRLMYASANENQEFGIMPSAQWVIKQKDCLVKTDMNTSAAPEVQIFNREYANNSYLEGDTVPVFEGQLYEYTDEKTKVTYHYIINHRDYYNPAKWNGTFDVNKLTCSDTLLITKVDPTLYAEAYNSEYHGYKHMDAKSLAESAIDPYYLKYNDKHSDEMPTNTDKFLYKNAAGYLAMTNPGNSNFEDQKNLFEIEFLKEVPYGYSDIKGLKQLKRATYALKVRDNNTIDNNSQYVVVLNDGNNNQRYAVKRLNEVNGQNVKLAEFYLKADELTYDKQDTCYVLVDTRYYDNKLGKDLLNAIELNRDDVINAVNENDKSIGVDHMHIWTEGATENATVTNNAFEGRTFINNGWQSVYIADDPDRIYPHLMDNEPNFDWTAFQLVKTFRPTYKPVSEERDVNGNVEISVRDGLTGLYKDVLFEMSANKYPDIPNVRKDVNYLGLITRGVPQGQGFSPAMYVDSVVTSTKGYVPMPQYMLWVANDSIADGYYCEDYLEMPGHGYFPSSEAADKDDMSHYIFYNGYVSGRMLVNFNDSIAKYNELNKLDEASKFKYNNRVRMGFVEGIHTYFTLDELLNEDGKSFKEGADKYFTDELYKYMTDHLAKKVEQDALADDKKDKDFEFKLGDMEIVYVLNNTTLEAIRDVNGKINPAKLKAAIDAKQIDVTMLNRFVKEKSADDKTVVDLIAAGASQRLRNYAWAFRYTEDDITGEGQGTGFKHADFIMETSGAEDKDLAAKFNPGSFEGDVAWLKLDGNVPVLARNKGAASGDHDHIGGTIDETINQGAILNMNATDEEATANEEIATSSVIVAGTNGAVVVKGAEGKSVIVSTILGKVVANEVLTSDNAQIAAPQGVVVVSVDGESFKVVVK